MYHPKGALSPQLMNLSLWEMTPWGPRGRPVSLWPEGGALGHLISCRVFQSTTLIFCRSACGLSLVHCPFCLASLGPIAVLSNSNRITARATYIILTLPVAKKDNKNKIDVNNIFPFTLSRQNIILACNYNKTLPHTLMCVLHSQLASVETSHISSARG